MKSLLLCSLIFLVMKSADCVNRKRLGIRPRPKPLFDDSKYSGQWFVQRRLPSTSWSIANLTDHIAHYILQKNQQLLSTETWRMDHCNYLTYVYTPSFLPGVYNLKDSIGDVMTGESIIVESDYVSYAVVWGCPKGSENGTCRDPYVRVQTRTSFPSSFTMLTIQYILHNLWKLSLNDMKHTPQVQPCDQNRMTDQGLECACKPDMAPVTKETIHVARPAMRPQPPIGPPAMPPIYFSNIPRSNGISPFSAMAMLPFLDGMA